MEPPNPKEKNLFMLLVTFCFFLFGINLLQYGLAEQPGLLRNMSTSGVVLNHPVCSVHQNDDNGHAYYVYWCKNVELNYEIDSACYNRTFKNVPAAHPLSLHDRVPVFYNQSDALNVSATPVFIPDRKTSIAYGLLFIVLVFLCFVVMDDSASAIFVRQSSSVL